MTFIKKIFITIASLGIASIPFIAAATSSIPFQATSTSAGSWVFPAQTSGNYLSVTSPIFVATSTSATSSFANGIQLTNGCFRLPGGTCAGTGGGATLSGGSPNTLTYWITGTTVGATSSPTVGYISATSSTATSTFVGNILIGSSTPSGGLGNGVPFAIVQNYDGPFQDVLQNLATTSDALACRFLDNNLTAGQGFGASYYAGICMASSFYNLPGFNAVKPNGLAVVASDGDVSIGSGSLNSASSSVRFFVGGNNNGSCGTFDSCGQDAVFYGGNGFLGLGTTTPYRRLSVYGSSDLGTNALAGTFTGTSTTGTSTLAGFLNVTGTNSTSTISGSFAVGTATPVPFSVTPSGTAMLGIGTSTPYRTLSVYGSSDLGNNALAGYFTGTTTSTSTFNGDLLTTAIRTTATSTSANGFNITTGCFAVNNVCAGTGAGTVTSVDVSGGTTGLTTSGGPVTTSGTITVGGTLAIANGGTNSTSLVPRMLTWYDGTRITSTSSAVTVGSLIATTTLATSTFNGGVNFASTTSTTTFADGINLLGGCYQVNFGACITGGSTLSGGSVNTLAYWLTGTTIGATSSPTVGVVVATSTTASSSFANGINLTAGCYAISGNCINAGGGSTVDFASSTSFTTGISYLATTSLIVTAYAERSGSPCALRGITDSSNPPNFIIASSTSVNTSVFWTGIDFPVKKNNYFEVTGVNCIATSSVYSAVTGGGSQWITTGNDIYYNLGKVGIGTTTPTTGLSVVQTGVVNPFSVATTSTASSTLFVIDAKGHMITGGATPTLNSCGTASKGPFGDDGTFFMFAGSGVLTSCVINFGSTWTKVDGVTKIAPACQADDVAATALALDATTTPTTVTITGTSLTSVIFSVQCRGSDNFPPA